MDSVTTVAGESDDEKLLRFTVGGGSGTYGRTIEDEFSTFIGYSGYGCEDAGAVYQTVHGDFNFKDEFKDYGGELNLQVSKSVHVGLRGGRVDETVSYWSSSLDEALADSLFQRMQVSDSSFSYRYYNPYFAYEKPKFGIGLGVVLANNRLWTEGKHGADIAGDDTHTASGHLRFGRLDKLYVKASFWEGVPIYSGGGKFVAGIGGHPVAPLDLFAGVTTGGPYSNPNLLLRAELDLGRHLTLGGTTRLKSDVDSGFHPSFAEHGTSVSLAYNLYYH